jgi:hypothetical protein
LNIEYGEKELALSTSPVRPAENVGAIVEERWVDVAWFVGKEEMDNVTRSKARCRWEKSVLGAAFRQAWLDVKSERSLGCLDDV